MEFSRVAHKINASRKVAARKRAPAPRVAGQAKAPTSIYTRMAGLKDAWRQEIGLDFQGAKDSRFRRRRQGLGGTADAHYAIEHHFWELREYARDMDRNDPLLGQLIDRWTDNVVKTGFELDSRIGDDEASKKIEAELERRWKRWSRNPALCDRSKRFTLHQMARLGLRHMAIDGDAFTVIGDADDGWVQLVEGDLCTSHENVMDDIVHGIKVDPETGEKLSYQFIVLEKGERERRGKRIVRASKSVILPARDDEGDAVVLHLYDPRRVSQTRGVTAFHAVFEQLGMYEDIQFAKLTQQQIVSCVAAVITAQTDTSLGGRYSATPVGTGGTSNTERTFEELAPGIVARLGIGEDIKTVSPSFNATEWLEQATMVIRTIFAQIGMPLSIGLLDTSNTTFHGYRGEIEQARIGWECTQRLVVDNFYAPIYRVKAKQWLREMGIEPTEELLEHEWKRPGWPYIDPRTDAEAERLRLRSGLDSLRRVHAQRGREWKTVAIEMVEDRDFLHRKAYKAIASIKEEFPELAADLTFEGFMGLDAPDGTKQKPEQKQEGGGNEPKPAE